MMLITLVLLLGGAAGTFVLIRRNSPYTMGTALAMAVLALLFWLAGRGQLPLAVAPGAPAVAPWQLSFSWQVDEAAWQMSLYLLILLVAALLVASGGQSPAGQQSLDLVAALWLTPAGLLAIWSESLPTLLLSWSILAMAWIAVVVVLQPAGSRDAAPWVALVPLLAPLLLWPTVAGTPASGSTSLLELGNWPAYALLPAVLAALWQAGVLPFLTWRMTATAGPWPVPIRPLLYLVPAAAGAMLLVRVSAAGSLAGPLSVLLTLSGLLGVLAATYLAWTRLGQRRAAAAALLLASLSFLLLAATWGGAAATLAEARVLLLAGGVLFLTPAVRSPSDALRPLPQEILHRAAPLLAVAALAATPLTSGFAGRTALYNVWLDGNRWLLLVIAALLHAPLLAAGVLAVWSRERQATIEAEEGPADIAPAGTTRLWSYLPVAGLWLAALSLLSLVGLNTAGVVSWLAILLPLVLGLLLVRFVGETSEVQEFLREALRLPRPLPALRPRAGRVLTLIATALRQAAAILESEGGLLWLLFLLLLFVVAR